MVGFLFFTLPGGGALSFMGSVLRRLLRMLIFSIYNINDEGEQMICSSSSFSHVASKAYFFLKSALRVMFLKPSYI